MSKKVYQELATRFTAYNNCIKNNNKKWKEKHSEVIEGIIKNLPHGSGIDGKTEFDYNSSKDEKLIINSEYHVMDENGFYVCWIDFVIIVKPSLQFGFTVDIKGKFGKYQDIRDYLTETFSEALNQDITA